MQNPKLNCTLTQTDLNHEHSSRGQTIVMSDIKKEDAIPENIPIASIFDISDKDTKQQNKPLSQKIILISTMFYMSLLNNMALLIIYFQKNLFLHFSLVIGLIIIERASQLIHSLIYSSSKDGLIQTFRNTLFFLDPLTQRNSKFFVIHSIVIDIPCCWILSHGMFVIDKIEKIFLPLLILNILISSSSLTILNHIVSKKVKSTNFTILQLLFQFITQIIEQISLITQFIVIFSVCVEDETYNISTIIYWHVFISGLGFIGTVSITCVLKITNQYCLYFVFSFMIICISVIRYILGIRIFEKTMINEDFDQKVQSFLKRDNETKIFIFDHYFYLASRIIQITLFFGLFLREYQKYQLIIIVGSAFNSLLLIYCLIAFVFQQKNKFKVYMTDK